MVIVLSDFLRKRPLGFWQLIHAWNGEKCTVVIWRIASNGNSTTFPVPSCSNDLLHTFILSLSLSRSNLQPLGLILLLCLRLKILLNQSKYCKNLIKTLFFPLALTATQTSTTRQIFQHLNYPWFSCLNVSKLGCLVWFFVGIFLLFVFFK